MNDSYNHHTNSYWEDIQVHCHAYLEKWQKRKCRRQYFSHT